MVERIVISRDEVLHYPWLDHTWVYVYFAENPTTKNVIFAKILEMLFTRGVSAARGQKFEGLLVEANHVFIKYNTDKIIDILKGACSWVLKSNWTVKDPTSRIGAFFIENRETFTAFFEETKKMLEEKTYKYYYQSVDGMN